ncbi:hypothetical protein PybrP1_005899, partial [[Pythium] brassicae (nom. inval.)]
YEDGDVELRVEASFIESSLQQDDPRSLTVATCRLRKFASKVVHDPTVLESKVQSLQRRAASVSLVEVFAACGFVIDELTLAPTISNAIEKMKLRLEAGDVRRIIGVVRNMCLKVLRSPNNSDYWRIRIDSPAFQQKLGRFDGAVHLLEAAGFIDAKRTHFELRGARTADGKRASALTTADLATLRESCVELDAELSLLDGVESICSILQRISTERERTSPLTLDECQDILLCLSTYIENVLKNPKDARCWRIREANATFQKQIGRLPFSVDLMDSIGYELVRTSQGNVYALRGTGTLFTVGSEQSAPSRGVHRADASLSNFSFSRVSQQMEWFLWRKKQEIDTLLQDEMQYLVDIVRTGTAASMDTKLPYRPESELLDKSAAIAKMYPYSKNALDTFNRSSVQRKQIAMMKKVFDAIDSENRGFVVGSDFDRARNSEGAPPWATFAAFDTDADGRVDFADFPQKLRFKTSKAAPQPPQSLDAATIVRLQTVAGVVGGHYQGMDAPLSSPPRMTTPSTSAAAAAAVGGGGARRQRLPRPASLYDEYPLAAGGGSRGSWSAAAASPTRARAQSQYSDAAAATSPSAFDQQQQQGECRGASLHSTFGKFHGEVYESKERSKVLSVLKRRAKANSGDARSGGALATLRSAPAKFTADDIVRAGTLTKEGSWRRNWKTRFFILRRDFPCLCYYTSEDKLELLGEIPILPDTIVLDRSAAGHAPFRFQIRSAAKTLLLEAETRDAQRRWVDSCQELVDAVRADKFRGSTTGLPRTSLADRGSSDARPSHARTSNLVSAAAQQRAAAARAAPAATTATATASVTPSTGTSAPLAISSSSAFSVDSSSVEFLSVSSATTAPGTSWQPGGGLENNPLFTNSSRALLEDPNFDWSQLIEASSSSSWNEDSDGESDGADYANTGQSTVAALEPMAEDQVTDAALHSGRGRGRSRAQSKSGKITIVSLNPSTVARRRKALFDLSIEVSLGRKSKLMRTDGANEKTGCFMKISGYLKQTKALVDIGSTDAIKVSTLLAAAAASYPGEKAVSVPFSIIVSTELEQFAQLRFTLYKCSMNQGPGTAQSCLGIGRCHVTDNFLNSIPKTIVLAEKSSTRESLQDALVQKPPQQVPSPVMVEEVEAQTTRGGRAMSLTSTNDGIQIAIRAFPTLSPQEILPTTGVDMATTKYLIPTTVPSEDSPTSYAGRLTRCNSSRVLVDNGSFLGGNGSDAGASPSVRYVAVDEILRVPRSTFALPLAYLDYLEEEVLERSRRLRKQLSSRSSTNHLHVVLVEFELEHCRKKTEEYMKQRQFLMRQEKRLLDEQENGEVFETLRTLKKVASKPKEGGAQPEVVAPFKRSTYKSLDGWQFLPTNMQDQFICVYQPATQPRDPTAPFVWHTMTMGCPAAHTKGFANGGYPHADMIPEEYNSLPTGSSSTSSVHAAPGSGGHGSSNPATSPASDSHCDEPLTSPMGGPSAAASTQTERTRRKSNALKAPHHAPDESTASLKMRLELKDRLDIIGSQILSAAVGCILATLDLAAAGSPPHQQQLENSVRFGYLMNFESLLSTQGKEIGMLEDFAAGAKWLRNVFSRSGHYLLVTIGVQESHLNVLPAALVAGKPFRMRCVLFTQGVNEKQSLVHAYKASSVKVQDRINRDNLEELKDLYAIFRRLNHHHHPHHDKGSRAHAAAATATATATAARRRASSVGDLLVGRYSVQALDELLAQIEHHICSPSNQFKKNVALLTDTSDFCRELGGARVTCCKSGKDRTAMSVTLEQARICIAELKATQGSSLCASMRLYGVRRKNVFLNTKADKFAFNEVQRKMLPECYKPPAGTYKSGKT